MSEISWCIVSLHARASKDVSEFASKAFKIGNIETGQEMLNWRRKTLSSLQLWEAKSLLLNSSLLSSGGLLRLDLGASSSEESSPVESLVRHWAFNAIKDCDNIYSPSSLLSCESMASPKSIDPKFDQRDFPTNQSEILCRMGYSSHNEIYKLTKVRQLTNSVLTRMVLLEHTAKGPKKGKVRKSSVCMNQLCINI